MKSEIKKGEKSTCTLTVKIEEAEIKEAHEKAVVSAIKTEVHVVRVGLSLL